MKKRTKIIIGAVVAVVIIGSIGSGGDDESTVEAAAPTTTEAPTITVADATTTIVAPSTTTTTTDVCSPAIESAVSEVHEWLRSLDAAGEEDGALEAAIADFDAEAIGEQIGLMCGPRSGEGLSALIVLADGYSRNGDGLVGQFAAAAMVGALCDGSSGLTDEAQGVCDGPQVSELEASDFFFEVDVLSSECYGSAGALVEFDLLIGWPGEAYGTLTYEISGLDDGVEVGTTEIEGEQYYVPNHFVGIPTCDPDVIDVRPTKFRPTS